MIFENNRLRSLKAADCDTDYYLMVAKVRERLAVSKHASTEIGWGKI